MRQVRSLVAVLTALTGRSLASCAYGTHLAPRAEGGVVEVNTFGYTGLIGPTNWVALDPANLLCSMGSRQSPIDLVDGSFTLVPASQLGLQLADMPEGTEFENLGTTVEVVAPAGVGAMTVGGTPFALQQFHFHLPSEHLDNGTSRAMEMHMVFESATGGVAVMSVFIDVENAGGEAAAAPAEAAPAEAASTAAAEATAAEATAAETATAAATETAAAAERRWVGRTKRNVPAKSYGHVERRATAGAATSSTLLETVFSSVGAISAPGSVTRTGPLVMSELLNTLSTAEFQSYSGSLTTPPCSEGVTWLVSTQRLQIQAPTFGAVRDVIGFNSRFPQNTIGQPNILQAGAVAMTQSLQVAQAQAALSPFGGASVIVV